MAREWLNNPIFYYPILWPEKLFKKTVFGCNECGQCILSYTALTCPMNCPKQLRNGPCGGTRAGGKCEVHPEKACVWNKIHRRAKKSHRLHLLEEIQPCVDWTMEGTSAWVNVFQGKIRWPRWR
jgi:hypothetical protein